VSRRVCPSGWSRLSHHWLRGDPFSDLWAVHTTRAADPFARARLPRGASHVRRRVRPYHRRRLSRSRCPTYVRSVVVLVVSSPRPVVVVRLPFPRTRTDRGEILSPAGVSSPPPPPLQVNPNATRRIYLLSDINSSKRVARPGRTVRFATTTECPAAHLSATLCSRAAVYDPRPGRYLLETTREDTRVAVNYFHNSLFESPVIVIPRTILIIRPLTRIEFRSITPPRALARREHSPCTYVPFGNNADDASSR